MKRILSLALSLIMTVNVCAVTIGSTITAYGATDYATQLKNKGFPESYINDFLHILNRDFAFSIAAGVMSLPLNI